MPTETEKFLVEEGDSTRLDRYLADRFEGVSRAYIQQLILDGLVRVNGNQVRKGHVLNPGEEVTVEPFPMPDERRIQPNPKIPIDILWQSADILVIGKSAGLPTHPNDYVDQESLANALLARFPDLQNVGDEHLRPGIVHRLDTDTSGLLLIARNQKTFRALRTLFDERKVKKTYLALVLGDLATPGMIDTPLAHHPTNPRKMVAVTPGTRHRSRVREARTHYRPLETFGGMFTLLEVRTETGRMHQVRVHLSSIGHPLAGDRIYQTGEQRKKDRSKLQRHFLHAQKIEFPLLPTNQLKSFESQLPPELEATLESLRQP